MRTPYLHKTVIIKFSNRWVKNEVLKRRHELDGSGLTVTEHLTPHTLQLLSAANKIVGDENTWIHNTIVFAQYAGIRYSIKTFKDLDLLSEKANNELPSIQNTPSISSPVMNTPLTQVSESTVSEAPSSVTTSVLVSGTPTETAVPNQQNKHYMNEYELNYPSLYQTLLFNKIPSRSSTMRMRGMPSRNGRGRGHRK